MQDGVALEASCETHGWLERHKALQDNLWTEYMKSLRVIRRGYLTVGHSRGTWESLGCMGICAEYGTSPCMSRSSQNPKRECKWVQMVKCMFFVATYHLTSARTLLGTCPCTLLGA